MNWDDLRVFLAVARAESLTGAARTVKLDPATLSRRIARLEEALGAALFVKSPQGYALTELGLRMADHAARAEAELALALEQGQPGLTGQVQHWRARRLCQLPAAAESAPPSRPRIRGWRSRSSRCPAS